MGDILHQLELNQTFFYQLAIFWILFLILANVYFKPFMKLFQARHQKTVEDREAAEKLLTDAEARFNEYHQRITAERAAARQDLEKILAQAKSEENAILAGARDQAKKITQEAAESASRQREEIKRQLEVDVESLALSLTDNLLSRRK